MIARAGEPARVTRTIVVRPRASRILIGTDYEFETLEGRAVGLLRLRLGRANLFESAETGIIELHQRGLAPITIEARRLDGTPVARLDHDLLAGKTRVMREVVTGAVPQTLDETGVLLPVSKLVEPGGATPLTLESWRLLGKEYRATIAPEGTAWTEEELLVVTALLLDLRASLAILYGVAATTGALAAAATQRRRADRKSRNRRLARRARATARIARKRVAEAAELAGERARSIIRREA